MCMMTIGHPVILHAVYTKTKGLKKIGKENKNEKEWVKRFLISNLDGVCSAGFAIKLF